MDILTIWCPNRKLEFPRDVLYSSVHIKETLIEKHFFGQFSNQKLMFLNFNFKQVECLIDFVRDGVVSIDTLKLFEYLFTPSNTTLDFALQALKYGYLNCFGQHIHIAQLYIGVLQPYYLIHTPEAQKLRLNQIIKAVKTCLSNIFLTNRTVQEYLVV